MEESVLDGGFCECFCGYAKIYTLHGLNTLPFYVGCTVIDVEERLSHHLSFARKAMRQETIPALAHKLIIENYFQISATIVDMIWVTGKDRKDASGHARFLEMKWVEKLKMEGYELANQQLVDMSTARPQYVGKIVYAA